MAITALTILSCASPEPEPLPELVAFSDEPTVTLAPEGSRLTDEEVSLACWSDHLTGERGGGLIRRWYTGALSDEEVTEFYDRELALRGWTRYETRGDRQWWRNGPDGDAISFGVHVFPDTESPDFQVSASLVDDPCEPG